MTNDIAKPAPQCTFMCWPTLDICFDIHADTEEKAMKKLRELTEDTVMSCAEELRKLGGKDGNADFNFITDCEPYIGDEDDK